MNTDTKPVVLFSIYYNTYSLRDRIIFALTQCFPGVIAFLIIVAVFGYDGVVFGIILGLFVELVAVSYVKVTRFERDDKRFDAAGKAVGRRSYADDYKFVYRALRFLGHDTRRVSRHIMVDDSVLVYVVADISPIDIQNARRIATDNDASSICIISSDRPPKHIVSKASEHDIALFDYRDIMFSIRDRIEQNQSTIGC